MEKWQLIIMILYIFILLLLLLIICMWYSCCYIYIIIIMRIHPIIIRHLDFYTRQINRPVSKLSHADMHTYCAHMQTLTALFMPALCAWDYMYVPAEAHEGKERRTSRNGFSSRKSLYWTREVLLPNKEAQFTPWPSGAIVLLHYIVVPSNHYLKKN